MARFPHQRTLKLAIGSVGAALYAVLIMPTIMVSFGPLGIAQLRPGVVVPMTIASVFGYLPGFLSSAFGNFVADLLMWGPDPGEIPGFLGCGVGAIVTAMIARIAEKRFKGTKRIISVIFGSALGIGWIQGLIIGIGNFLLGFIPTLEIALTVGSLIGIGNTIFACTVFPPVEVAVRKLVQARGLIQD